MRHAVGDASDRPLRRQIKSGRCAARAAIRAKIPAFLDETPSKCLSSPAQDPRRLPGRPTSSSADPPKQFADPISQNDRERTASRFSLDRPQTAAAFPHAKTAYRPRPWAKAQRSTRGSRPNHQAKACAPGLNLKTLLAAPL